MFYKAVVQQVLLFGSETWTLSQSMINALARFHNKAARRIARMMPCLVDGEWITPPPAEALEAAGMYPIDVYIEKRRATVADWVATRPIFEACTRADRLPGVVRNRLRWLHQDLEARDLG